MIKQFLIVLFLATAAFAQQRASFDILTYVPPGPGWEEEKTAESVVYTKPLGNEICAFSIIRAVPSVGTSRENFDLVWQSAVQEEMGGVAKPEMGKAGPKDGWIGEVGFGSFEKSGIKGAALLTTLTGNKMAVSVLALITSEDCVPDFERFVDNIKLPAITGTKPAAAPQPAASAADKRLIGRWNRSGSVTPSYADPASWGSAGYTKSRYEFFPDGTYAFTERTFRYSYQHILIVKEKGTYQATADTITIAPASSTITSYAKAGGTDKLGAVAKSASRPLEKATYRYTFHYFSGIQEWNLVLMADQPTQRDGNFSNNTTFQNAWYFDQKFTNTDLTAPNGQ